jgi:hypothetical protein
MQGTKNILIEGVNLQTRIYSENIDNYVNWYYSYFTSISKTTNTILGIFAGEKNSQEKFYLENFTRIMNKNAGFGYIIGEDLDRQTSIILNICHEYLKLKDYFCVSFSSNTLGIMSINDYMEPYIDGIILYFDHVFVALDNRDIFLLQDYTIKDNDIVKTAKTGIKTLAGFDFFGGILIDYLSLKTQELFDGDELRENLFKCMNKNQSHKIAIIEDPFNYIFDRLGIGSVLFADNYFVGLPAYQHYGVYIGNGNVIHFAPPEGKEISAENGIIHETSLEMFLKGRALQVDTTIEKIFSDEEIVQRAYSRLNEMGYDLLTNNCEHFARWCVTGEHISYQVINSPDKIVDTLSTIKDGYDMITKFIDLFN